MINYTWTIENLITEPTQGGYDDVVVTVFWKCVGNDGDYSGSIYSKCALPAPQSSFTPYSNLTQNQILQWCWDLGVNKTSVEALIQVQIDGQKTPASEPNPVVLPLPWA